MSFHVWINLNAQSLKLWFYSAAVYDANNIKSATYIGYEENKVFPL